MVNMGAFCRPLYVADELRITFFFLLENWFSLGVAWYILEVTKSVYRVLYQYLRASRPQMIW
jgi:hypothetical protein